MGGAPRRHHPRVLPDREAGQPRPAADARLQGGVLPDQSRAGECGVGAPGGDDRALRGEPMSIRTTHVGSLPRPEALTQLMYAHQEGQDVDLDAAVSGAVREVVEMQVRARIDVISDGEMGKPGFVNYVSDRLSGFGGQAAPWTIADLADAPELIVAQYGGEAGAHIMPANCEGPVSYVGHALLQRDIDNL